MIIYSQYLLHYLHLLLLLFLYLISKLPLPTPANAENRPICHITQPRCFQLHRCQELNFTSEEPFLSQIKDSFIHYFLCLLSVFELEHQII